MDSTFRTYHCLSLTLIFLFCFPIFSETILLKNGEVIIGQVTDQNDAFVKIQIENGKNVEINKNQILKIIYRTLTDTEIKKVHAEELKLAKEKEEEAKNLKKYQTKQRLDSLDKDGNNENSSKTKLNEWQLLRKSAYLPTSGLWEQKEKKFAIGYASLLFLGILKTLYYQEKLSEAQYHYDNLLIGSQIISVKNSSLSNAKLTDLGLVTNLETNAAEIRKIDLEYKDSIKLVGIVYLAQLLHTYVLAKKNRGVAQEENLSGIKFNGNSLSKNHLMRDNVQKNEYQMYIYYEQNYE
ncbi:MAG: hypothetical protein SH817_00550 [Leptospira sp.]|nr:hypothetical protein [Leptospira sp.]